MKARKLTAVLLCMTLLTSCAKGGDASESSAAGTSESEVAQTNESSSEGNTSGSSSASTGSSGSSISTGNLTETGNGYEGIEGTGDFNYGEALQKSLLFYELQRSGDLPEVTRCNWRGDSALNDGQDNGIDLTGGWYDAGDNVKFNLPMAYSAAMLGWSYYEYGDAYDEAGQDTYILDDIRWVTDYLMRCHPDSDTYYYQVGNGSMDHSWWGPAEVMTMERPSYYVDRNNPGSAVSGEAAAALAVASIIFEDSDPQYASLCLEHAESLFEFANSTRSDSGYTMAAGFYDSWSGFYDELAWAGAWLYLATDNSEYLDIAQECYPQASQDSNWAMCWDDVHIGAAILLARITGESTYKNAVEQHLNFWLNEITYTPDGLAWLDSWGSLRYATTTGFIATVYANSGLASDSNNNAYIEFAENQCNYALGSSGRSYVVGFGENPPEHPHHRTAQASYCDNMNTPSAHRHTLYGALVGGPDASDGYTDEVSNYNTNEVACDYNAGFTGLLAYMYSQYHGQTLVDFGAVEPVETEYTVDASINAQGDGFIEIKTTVYNMTAWPARSSEDVELRYFVDLSEIYAAGYSASDITISTNYVQSGSVDGLHVWNEDAHIYYLSIVYSDGGLSPTGQSNYKSEVQTRMTGPGGVWDNSNDYSFAGLGSPCTTVALYEDGVLVYGSEPSEDGSGAGNTVIPVDNPGSGDSSSSAGGTASSGSVDSDGVNVRVNYDSNGGNSFSGTITITNNSGSSISLNNLELMYPLTDTSNLVFDCYHAGMTTSGGGYSEVSGVSGTFGSDGCTIGMGSGSFADGSVITINFSIHRSDWQNMTASSNGDIVINLG